MNSVDRKQKPAAAEREPQAVVSVTTRTADSGLIKSENQEGGNYMLSALHFIDHPEVVGCFCLHLEEVKPADPGELSGVAVSMLDAGGELACLGVFVNARHELGHLCGRPLRQFLRDAVARVLGDDHDDHDDDVAGVAAELEEGFEPSLPNGAELFCVGLGEDTELAVVFRRHFFGVARGPLLRDFLVRALAHATAGLEEVETRPALVFIDSDRSLLRGMRIGEG
jgi:hypothetical protein